MQQIILNDFTRFLLLFASVCYLINAIASVYCTWLRYKIDKNGEKFDEYGLPILDRDVQMPKVKAPRHDERKEYQEPQQNQRKVYANHYGSLLEGGGYSPRPPKDLRRPPPTTAPPPPPNRIGV